MIRPGRAGGPAAPLHAAWDVVLILCIGLAAVAVLYRLAPPYWGHDTLPHLRWQAHFPAQLLQGIAYPRWLPELNEGFGSPAFFIYPPLAHYATSIWLALPGAGALERVQASMLLALVVSALAAYGWLGSFLGRRGALAGALLYMLAPYHLYVDLYRRAALSELWAFVWAPLALWALGTARQSVLRAFLLCSAAIAALLFTHPPSSLVLVPAIVCLAAFGPDGRRAGLVAAGSVLFGAALAAVYLGPALTHEPLTHMEVMFIEHMTYQRWLLFDKATYIGCAPGFHPHACQLAQVILLQFVAAALLAGVAWWRGPRERRPLLWALVGVNLLLAFMLTRWSAPVWEAVPLLRKIQFPFRLMVVQGFALAGLAGLAASRQSGTGSPRGRAPAAAAFGCVAILCAAQAAFALADRARGSVGDGHDRLPRLDTHEVAEYRLGDMEYLGALFGGEARWVLLEGEATVSVRGWHSRRVELVVTAPTPARIGLRQFDYSGWRYEIEGVSQRTLRLSADMPVAVLRVPAGRHDMVLTLEPTATERFGIAVSAAAALAWVVAFALGLYRGPRRMRAASPGPEAVVREAR